MKASEWMKRILNNSVTVLIACVLTGILIYFYVSSGLSTTMEQSLTEIAQQGALTVENDIQRQLDILRTIAKDDRIKGKKLEIQNKLRVLKLYLNESDLLRISIASIGGYSFTTDGDSIFIGDREYFKKAVSGQSYVSNPITSRVDGSLVVTFAVPILDGNLVTGVLYGTYPAEELSIMTDDIRLGEDGYSFILDKDGTIIAHKDRKLIAGKYDLEQITGGSKGATEYLMDGVEKYVGFAPINGTNWSIVVTTPRDQLFKGIDQLLVFLIVSIVFILLSFIFIYLYNVRLKRNLQKEVATSTSVIKTANIVIIRLNFTGNILDFNEYAENKTGYKKEELIRKRNIFDLVAGENKLKFKKVLEDYKEGKKAQSFEVALDARDRKKVYFLWNFNSEYIGKKDFEIIGIDITERVLSEKKLIASNEEISATYEELIASQEELSEKYNELKANQEKLERSEERYSLVTEAAGTGIWDWDLLEGKRFYSSKWYECYSFDPGDIDGVAEKWDNMIFPEDREALDAVLAYHKLNHTDHFEYDYRINKDGECRWIKAVGKSKWDKNGVLTRMAGSDTDITELKNYQNKLHDLAYRDALTNLPNRASMNERLTALINGGTDKKCALLFIDSDNIKMVNDTLGHDIGDQLIIQIGKRLESLLGKHDMVFRLGGDEFILVMTNFQDINKTENFAKKVMKSFQEPFKVQGSTLNVTVSIGISIYPLHGKSTDELLKNADIAMYRAKELGKNRYVVFYRDLDTAIIERMNIERHLREAHDNNEFILHYQPQIDIKSGEISSFEALVRWNSPEMGIVSPLKFIKIAEESKLIIPLGKLILYDACLFIKKVHESGYIQCKISVNISIIQLMQENFVDMVLKTLEIVELNPEYLELEITESILMESFESINRKLELLRQKGVGIALDDFGKGYSSLNYLKQLPISILKIDKSFIDNISGSDNKDTLAGTIVLIGHNMGMTVVAEGVETQEQLSYLIKGGCDKVQGFLFSEPLPEDEAIQFLSNKNYTKNT